MNLVERFLEQVRAAPERVAIAERVKGESVATTYAELDELSRKAAGFLKRLGVGVGDTVLVFERMSTRLYAVLIGLWRVGAVAMFIDPAGGRKLVDASCRIRSPKLFLATSKAHLFRLLSKEVRRIPLKVTLGCRFLPSYTWSDVLGSDTFDEVVKVGYGDSALYTFTSGSTGRPKAADRTHGALLAQHDALVSSIELEAGEVDLATLPIFTLANLASGLVTVIPDCDLSRPGFFEAGPVLEQIRLFQPDRSVASPSFFMRLAAATEAQGERLPFKKVYTGGAPVFPKYCDRLAAVVSDCRINIVYGSTEAEPIAHVATEELTPEVRRHIDAGGGLLVGKPCPEAVVRIIEDRQGASLFKLQDSELQGLSLGPGEVGEIIVSGEHVLKGYLNGEGDAENMIHAEGTVWHRTGDAGCLDEEGRLWLYGRCSSRIRFGDRWVYPFSVEAAVSSDARLRWSAFIEYEGARTLVVELAEGDIAVTLDELPLPEGLVEKVHVVKRMPLDKRHNAKIDYGALRALLAKE